MFRDLRQFDGAFRRFMLILKRLLPLLKELAYFSTWFILYLPPSLCIIPHSRGVRQRLRNLEAPGSNPVGDFFLQTFLFSWEDLNKYIFHQNPSVEFNYFFTTVRKIIVLLNKILKRDFLQNVFPQMNFFLKNAE